MPRRDNRQIIAASPTVTEAFQSKEASGSDGAPARNLLLTCAGDSAAPLEYRIESPQDPVGEWARLEPGEAFMPSTGGRLIEHVQMRGVGGIATGGVEEQFS